jgi:hypothetical protein
MESMFLSPLSARFMTPIFESDLKLLREMAARPCSFQREPSPAWIM